MHEPSGGEKLFAYYLTYEKDFRRFFKKSKKKSLQKDIHRFRVSTKKLKSIFKLIALCDDSFNSSLVFKSYKKLFKAAGKVRECHVNQSRITELNVEDEVMEGFMTWQKKRIKVYKKKFAKAILQFDKATVEGTRLRIQQSCENLSSDLLIKNVLDFIEYKRKGIEELSLSELTIPAIHNIRIKIKQISTILGLFDSLDVVGHKLVKENALREFENALGHWHDHVILKDALIVYEQELIQNAVKQTASLQELIIYLEKEEKSFTENINDFISRVLATISLNNL